MAMIETNESQIGLSFFSTQRYNKTNNDELRFISSSTFNSFRSPPSTDEIIIIDDDDEVTLEPTKKKPRLGYRYDPFDELSIIFKGLPEAKKDSDVALIADSCLSSTDLDEKTTREKNDDEQLLSTVTSSECDEEKTNKKKKKDDDENVAESTTPSNKGYGHVSLDDLGVSVEDLKNIPWEAFNPTWELMSDPWYRGYIEDNGLSSIFYPHT